nr:AraC family transcriptional regulator [uncultured Vibrio sp.]
MKQKNKEIATFKIAQELGGLELLDAKYEKQHFSRHSHEGYTIGVIEKGAQKFFRTGGNHIAPQDSIILINADEVHSGHSASEGGWEYKAMYPVPDQFQTLGQELSSPNIALPYFPQPVVYDPELANQLRLVFEMLEKSDNRLLRETLVYGTLIKLTSKHSTHRAPLQQSTKAQKQVMLVKEFLEDFPQSDVSLEELAKLAALSPFHLLREFQKQFGFPPHAFQIQQRLRMAKQLLKQGRKISDVAQECGFHDQSHLHRHFKKAMGITPGQYTRYC